MNKEQQELVDESYKRYHTETLFNSDNTWLEELDGMNLSTGEETKVHRQYAPMSFINKCKTDKEFSEKWGLKIEERELSWEERKDLLTPEQYDGTILENGQRTGFGYISPFTDKVIHYWMNLHNIPTKLITITYNDKTIESYEMDGKLCYCGNPVDTSNPDCVTFNLCKEHQMDA